VFLGAPGDETDQGTFTTPRSINDQGVVVGDYQQIVGTQAGSTVTPWLQQGTSVTNLPTLGGSVIEANAVNSNGVVVGDARKADGNQVGTEWVNGKISSLGTLSGGTWGEALAINSSGEAVGSATTPGNPINLSDAVMFSNGKAINLNVPGAGQGSAHATAINDSGVIVGDDAIDPDLLDIGNSFIYQNSQATELNTLIAPTPSVRLAGATDINDAGDIVGIADVIASEGTQMSVGYELLPITTS
jgi:probable HAF family extracellular repeat protein